MKKIFKIRIFIIMMIFSFASVFSTTKVNASFPYMWTIDGERIIIGYSNKSGTASWIADDNYPGGVLTLNNYNGGQLKIDCYGSCSINDAPFAIKLVGDNKITVEKGVGIIANAPIVFIGDGKLTINAVNPIVNDYGSNFATTTTVMIEPSIINNLEENSSFLDSNLFKVVVLSYCVISLIIIIILIAKLKSKRKDV